MADVSNFLEAKIFINFAGEGGGGFSENYKFNSTTYSYGLAALREIASRRSALLAYGWSIVHATQSLKTTRGDSSLAQADPTRTAPYSTTKYHSEAVLLDAEADLTTDALGNDKQVGLLYNFDTGVGFMAPRLIRAIRDSWVANEVTTLTLPDIAFTATLPETAAADASALAVGNYIKSVLYYTQFFQKRPVAVPQEYNPIAWATANYMRISYRDMGRGFSSRKSRRKRTI